MIVRRLVCESAQTTDADLRLYSEACDFSTDARSRPTAKFKGKEPQSPELG
jgi:hypothetical protein